MPRPTILPLEHAVIAAPFGHLGLSAEPEVITAIRFLPADAPLQPPRTGSLCAQLAEQLAHYWQHPEHVFSLPLRADGTPFQQRVWQAMLAIPPGQVARYGDLARQLGSAARAVGGACGRNPLSIVIPCHRVVAAHDLGGFNQSRGESTLSIKRWLLQHEGSWPGTGQ